MLGYALILCASIFFCIQNVVVRILFANQILIGIGPTGGFLAPTLQNSFLLLLLRMLLAVPLMAVLATRLYPGTWKELRELAVVPQRTVLFHSLVGGGLMFSYLALLYISIGLIPTGIALTLFFTFPVFTALFSWQFFGHRLSALRWGIMGAVLVGCALTVPAEQWTGNSNPLGVVLGVAAGIAYALYTVNAQKSFDYLHPVSYTWVSFAITLLLSAGCLLIWPREYATELAWYPIWIGSLISGFVTFAGHVLYNSGIRHIGATSASMIGAANPALTVVLAWATIRETLSVPQTLGVTIVTVSIILLSRFSR